jgi:arylsulfatase A-like enzyme
MPQPNFLLIITDQHRADHLGCAGNPVVRTPNIDALASRGSRFANMYVACPVCMPNRASIMTGRLPSLHGVRHNGVPLSHDATTFVDVLRAAGYHTALIGKSHLQNFTGLPAGLKYEPQPDLRQPPIELREAHHNARSGAQYDLELTRNWRGNSEHVIPTPHYGFEFIRLVTDHGDQCGGEYEAWLRQHCPDYEKLRGPANAAPDDRIKAPQAWRTRIPEQFYPTTYIAGETEQWLRQQRADRPFFVQMSFPDPHHPFTPPGHYWDMYDPADMALPPSFGKGDLPPLRIMRQALADGTASRTSQDPFVVTERETRDIIALTYGMITMIDDAIGRVLRTLSETGLAENTVVIFMSDHGDFMGDHGLMLKLLLHYQGLIRVPLIWSDPAVRHDPVNTALACSLDIAPSILKRAGIQPFNGIQGRDLFDLAGVIPDGLLIEEDSQRAMVGYERPQRVRTLVNERWRLSVRQDESWGELYDLTQDPLEIHNLWDEPAHAATRSWLIEKLAMRMIALQERSPLPSGRA